MCITPIILKSMEQVPCSKCPDCKARRVSAWSFRLMQQFKIAKTAFFITLTYDTQFVPITDAKFMTLQKRDMQLFFKRLRKAHEKIDGVDKIKYYAAGEYGGKTKRPHYHIILFNAIEKLIQPAWNLGQIHYGTVSEASVGYCLKYINKPTKIPLFKGDDRQKEFALMSKGLGLNYLTKNMVDWHHAEIGRMYVNTNDGKKVSMPRYYKEKIFTTAERLANAQHFMDSKKIVEPDDLIRDFNDRKADVKAAFQRQHFLTSKIDKL